MAEYLKDCIRTVAELLFLLDFLKQALSYLCFTLYLLQLPRAVKALSSFERVGIIFKSKDS